VTAGVRRWVEGVTSFGLSAVGIYLFVRVPDFVSGWSLMLPGTTDQSLSPSFFPRVALAVLGLVAALSGVASLQHRTASEDGDETVPIPTDAIVHSPQAVLGWSMLLICYLASMWAIGFYASSALMICTVGWIAGYRQRIILLIFALLAPAAVEILFSRGLRLRLPVGHWLDFSLTAMWTWT